MVTAARSIPIVVIAGQSNALNSAVSTGVMKSVADNHGLLLQNAVNGAPLSGRIDRGDGDWAVAGGELYASLVAQIAAYLDPNSPAYVPGAYLAGVVWVQGEADTWNTKASTAYQANLTALNADLARRFGTHEFVVSGLSDHAGVLDDSSQTRATNWNLVQTAQRNFDTATPHSTLINPDQLALQSGFTHDQMFQSDGLHYNTGFGLALGEALGDAIFTAPRAVTGLSTTIQYAYGTRGEDTFTHATPGWKQIFGAGGIDVVKLGDLPQGVTLIGTGDHILRLTSNDSAHATTLDLVSIERIFLTKYDDIVRLDHQTINLATDDGNDSVIGSDLADKCWLGRGNDRSLGRDGNDLTYGGDGNDSLLGGAGADTLFGDSGRDRITGGVQNDLLAGGQGADTFVFAGQSGRDRIIDFENGLDRIDLSAFHTSFAALHITTSGTTTEIGLPGGATVLLNLVSRNSIDASDFLF